MKKKTTEFDFWYAVRNTRIIQPPKRHIETFGATMLHYRLISPLMDDPAKIRIREGRLQAFKPQIIIPSQSEHFQLDGFGEEAKKYMEWVKEHEDHIRILRYGYTLKQETFSEQIVTDSIESVIERVQKDPEVKSDPFSAIVHGVDDPWDVSLLKLFWSIIQQSAPENIREMQERHLFDLQRAVPKNIHDEVEKGFREAAQNATLIRPLGKFLQENGLFETYQDRFFKLLQNRG